MREFKQETHMYRQDLTPPLTTRGDYDRDLSASILTHTYNTFPITSKTLKTSLYFTNNNSINQYTQKLDYNDMKIQIQRCFYTGGQRGLSFC